MFILLAIIFFLLVSCQYQLSSSQKEVEYISAGILVINSAQEEYAHFKFYYDDIHILTTNVINASKNEFYTQNFIRKPGDLRVEAAAWTTRKDHSRISKTIPFTGKIPPPGHTLSITVEFNGNDILVEERFIPTV